MARQREDFVDEVRLHGGRRVHGVCERFVRLAGDHRLLEKRERGTRTLERHLAEKRRLRGRRDVELARVFQREFMNDDHVMRVALAAIFAGIRFSRIVKTSCWHFGAADFVDALSKRYFIEIDARSQLTRAARSSSWR